MRVECNTVDEFLICLSSERSIFQDVIRVSITRNPIDTGRDCVKFDVILQATTVVLVDSESQYLLVVGCNCGKDYEDASQELEGSASAKKLKDRITQYAKERSWGILPGIINI